MVRSQAPAVVVHLDNSRTQADLLLTAARVKPDMSISRAAGIAHDVRVSVDDYMRTNVANVWAAGDCRCRRGTSSANAP